MPSFCRLELPLWLYKDTVSILFKPSCVMLYTRDFVSCYYVHFSQIRSQFYSMTSLYFKLLVVDIHYTLTYMLIGTRVCSDN